MAAVALPGAPLIDLNGVQMALAVCEASAGQIAAIVAQGINRMGHFLMIEEKEVDTMMSNITQLAVNRGGIVIGAIVTKMVKGLVYWCKEQNRQGNDLDARRFTQDILLSTLERMSVELGEEESKPELPTKFDHHKWVSWVKKLENYLWQIKGKNNTPLFYVVRKTRTADSPPFQTIEEERIYQTAHRGAAYAKDDQKVFEILTQLLSGTPAWTWISSHEATVLRQRGFMM